MCNAYSQHQRNFGTREHVNEEHGEITVIFCLDLSTHLGGQVAVLNLSQMGLEIAGHKQAVPTELVAVSLLHYAGGMHIHKFRHGPLSLQDNVVP